MCSGHHIKATSMKIQLRYSRCVRLSDCRGFKGRFFMFALAELLFLCDCFVFLLILLARMLNFPLFFFFFPLIFQNELCANVRIRPPRGCEGTPSRVGLPYEKNKSCVSSLEGMKCWRPTAKAVAHIGRGCCVCVCIWHFNNTAYQATPELHLCFRLLCLFSVQVQTRQRHAWASSGT